MKLGGKWYVVGAAVLVLAMAISLCAGTEPTPPKQKAPEVVTLLDKSAPAEERLNQAVGVMQSLGVDFRCAAMWNQNQTPMMSPDGRQAVDVAWIDTATGKRIR